MARKKQSIDALLVIDMQHAYFKDDVLAAQKPQLARTIQHYVDKFAKRNKLIINVTTIHSQDKSTWTLNTLEDDAGFLLSGSDESQPIITLPKNTIEVTKTRDSAFHETNLIDVMRKHNVGHLTIVGVSAHTCIFHTAAAAYAYNVPVTLVRDGIGDEDHEAMIRSFDYLQQEYRQRVL